MEPKDWIPLLVQTLLAIGTLAGAWPLLKRVRYQNNKDSVDAMKVALEIAGIDATEQLELKKKVHVLEEILEKKRYRITVVFKLGERPTIEEASIDSFEIEHP